jgi:hypothetical protein
VFGPGGSGKNEYVMRFLANAPSQCVYIFDDDLEFSERMNIQPARTQFELVQAVQTGWVCFDPHTMFQGHLEEAVEFLAHFAMVTAPRLPGRKFFVMDESGMKMDGHNLGEWVQRLVQSGGRVGGIDGVWIAQGPNELHNAVRRQLTEVVCFQITEDTGDWLKNSFRFDVEQLKALQKFRYICRNKWGGEARG